MPKKVFTVMEAEPILDEDEAQVGVCVTDVMGKQLNVKRGKGGKLRQKWAALEPGKTFEFEMGEYKGYPYVADFNEVRPSKSEEKGRPQSTNASIEAQVAAKAITELWIAGKLGDDSREVRACRQWFLSKFPPIVPQDSTHLVKAITDEGGVIEPDREFENAGAFLMQVLNEFNYTKTRTLELLGKKSLQEVTDFQRAWVFLKTIYEKDKQEAGKENA